MVSHVTMLLLACELWFSDICYDRRRHTIRSEGKNGLSLFEWIVNSLRVLVHE